MKNLYSTLSGKVVYSTAINMFQQVIIFVGGVLVARLVGPEKMGLIAYATAFVGLFTPLTDLGFGSAHTKRVSEGYDLGQCMGMIWISKIFCVLLTVFVIIGAYKFQEFNKKGYEFEIVFLLALINLAVNQLSMVPITTFSAFQNIIKKDVPPAIVQILNAIFRLLTVALGFGVIGISVVDLSTSIILLTIYLLLIRKLPISWPTFTTLKRYAIFSGPMFLISIFTNVGDRLNQVILQSFGGLASVGQYSAGMRIGSILQFLSAAVAGVIFPSISLAFMEGRQSDANALCIKAEHRLAIILFPTMVILTGFARPLVVFILGQKYLDSGPVIVFGMMTFIFQALSQPFRQLMVGAERLKICVIIHGIILSIQVVLSILLLSIPISVLPGMSSSAPKAALAIALSSLIGFGLWRFASKFLNVSRDNRVIFQSLLVILLIFITYSLGMSADIYSLRYYIIFIVLIPMLYIMMLLLTKFFDLEDRKFFFHLINQFVKVNHK